jgi:energy-converting hydrogenase A subunit M
MKVAIMQPYFFPYIGYFQLINSVDKFIIYDNIQYTKKGWINRNRILVNKKDQLITLPIRKDSDYLNIIERELSESWEIDKNKMLNVIKSSYNKAPYFQDIFELISKCLNNPETNLFKFIYDSIISINNYLEIKTPIIISSTVDIDHTLKSQDKVLSLCKKQNTDTYINSIGGVELYDKETFKKNNIELNFIKSNPIQYKQFNNEFISWLSIIDVMMFNSKQQIKEYLNNYTLI